MDHNVESKTIEMKEKDVGVQRYDLGAGQDFLNRMDLTTSEREIPMQKGPHFRQGQWSSDRSRGDTCNV